MHLNLTLDLIQMFEICLGLTRRYIEMNQVKNRVTYAYFKSNAFTKI